MSRFKRIATGGWLGKFLQMATFGYYPIIDGGPVSPVSYVVLADAAIRLMATADDGVRIATGAVDVEL